MTEEPNKSEIAKKEEEILKFWKDNNIFEKSLKKDSPKGNYVFYDGPPFATGLPHHGHILASTIKDAVPRYFTMRGYHVDRRWGWDTHGLPIENIVEKELGISGKKEIEKIGVEKFNSKARSKVLEYVNAWKKTVDRIARWVDFDGAYLTMSNSYIESVWWALKEVDKKGLLYEGEKVLPYCPRCETPIANSEIAMDNSYKDIKDISVYVKFELKDENNTFLIAWTTTAWTLPGNVAAAVSKEVEYVKVKTKDSDEKYIVAKDLAEHLFKDLLKVEYEVLEKVSSEDLIGKSYTPVFDYYKDVDLKNKENIWRVWDADYVTTEQGTGVVHLAPAYGEEDMELAKEVKMPVIHHVLQNGTFDEKVSDFAGMKVKPKEDHQSTDIEIIKNLAHRGKLFAKEKIDHSYPHCFRCEHPLYYSALSAWFIKVQEIKNRALELNNDVHWVPDHLKEGRFKKSMEGAPDWNISRNRYWASPLPFWKSEDGVDTKVIGSVDELREKTRSTNKYYAVRHGQAESNAGNFVNSDNSVKSHLTEQGKDEALSSTKNLKDKDINLIITSPLLRTKETAEIIAKEIGLSNKDIIVDDRIKEIDAGVFNGKSNDEYRAQFKDVREKMIKPSQGGESVEDMRVRVGEFLYDIDKKYKNKNILIVTHEYAVWMLVANTRGLDLEQAVKIKELHDDFVPTGHVIELDFAPLPHNDKYELDIHKPYIDQVTFEDGGKVYRRIPEVVDCWVESGSMPFAQKHYPFADNNDFKKNFPAQFIAEYIAQTRTWFYYTHIMSTILFDSIAFKNVVTTGNILAEDGSKMSKSKQNFPDPWMMFDKYGVDSLRYYLLSSPVMKSEDLNFSEKGVDEIYKKIILRLQNVVSFYEMYAENVSGAITNPTSENILDQWILARLEEVKREVTNGMEIYELDQATRPFMDFIDDLSTWYLRRSRDRFKGDDALDTKDALETLRFVLADLAKLMAPFTPFIAEDIYKRVNGEEESVHLEEWPYNKNVFNSIKSIFNKKTSSNIISDMEKVRETVTNALEARTSAGIKVRQPLSMLFVKETDIADSKDLIELIADEVNVKNVTFDSTLDVPVKLDTTITKDLQDEGDFRELIRAIQSLRKEYKLQPSDKVTLHASANVESLLQQFANELEKVAGVENTVFDGGDREVELSEMRAQISIK